MILTYPMGPIDANCYLVINEVTKEAAAVDPSDADAVCSILREKGLTLTHILLTHRHFDHLAGVAALKQRTLCRVMIHSLDKEGLLDSETSRAAMLGGVLTPCEPTDLVQDGDVIHAAGYEYRVLYTPGHTEGGVCYVCDEGHYAFTGDTVFFEGIGRTDLPTGNMRKLMHSLFDVILQLPPNYVLYPGHGESTTVAHECVNNPMLRYRGNPWFN